MKVRTFASLVLSGVVVVALAGCAGSVSDPPVLLGDTGGLIGSD